MKSKSKTAKKMTGTVGFFGKLKVVWLLNCSEVTANLTLKEAQIIYYIPSKIRSATISCDRRIDNFATVISDDCIPAEAFYKKDIITFRFSKMTAVVKKKKMMTNDTNDIEEWKKIILEEVEMIDEARVHQVVHQEESNAEGLNFDIITDGGVFELSGVFGMVITDGNHPLITNKGKIYSVEYLESPYRSEMFGVLAGLVTFQDMFHQVLNKQVVNINIYCDNKPVIKRIKDRLRQRRTVNQYRDADVDIELQVLEEMRRLKESNCIVKIHYVKGHQELKKSKDKLSHVEKMNVMADLLTKAARLSKSRKEYNTFPMNKVNVKLNDNYINSKYAHVTETAYHSIGLRQYLQYRHKWNNKTIESIWWKAYYKSFEKLCVPDRTRVHKFIHNKMSTNKRDNLYYNKCPYCKECRIEEIEDEDHIIQCLSEKRKKLRADWLAEIKEFLSKSHTPENVKDAMYSGLQSWLEPSCSDVDPDYGTASLAYQQQESIGWGHFIRGRMSIEWGNCVKDHIKKQKIKGMSYAKWGSSIYSINWKHILIIWKERNGTEHGVTLTEQEDISRRKLIEEIVTLYNQNEAILLRSVVSFQIDDLEVMNSAQLTTYLYGIKIIIKMYITKEKKVRQNDIGKYFNKTKDNSKETQGVSITDKSELDPGEIALQ